MISTHCCSAGQTHLNGVGASVFSQIDMLLNCHKTLLTCYTGIFLGESVALKCRLDITRTWCYKLGTTKCMGLMVCPIIWSPTRVEMKGVHNVPIS
jgi:hypothetical protein